MHVNKLPLSPGKAQSRESLVALSTPSTQIWVLNSISHSKEPGLAREIARYRTEGVGWGGELLAGPETLKVFKGFREMSKGHKCQLEGSQRRESLSFQINNDIDR